MTPGVEALVGFGRELREAGLRIDTARTLQFCRAAALVDEQQIFWAGLATLVSREEDVPVYERVFESYFGDGESPRRNIRIPHLSLVQAEGSADGDGKGEEPGATGSKHPSRLELLRDSSFDPLDLSERKAHAELVRRASHLAPSRPVRRYGSSPWGDVDLRQTARWARMCGGEPVKLAHRRRREKLRHIVAIIDVSGSMGDCTRSMLVFLNALSAAGLPGTAFALGTRVTDITTLIARRDPGETLAAVAETVPDLKGGTRIGDGLHDLLGHRSGVESVRGATVVIHSDGLETGSFRRLEHEMERLARLAASVVWVNPHLGEIGYEPTAGGMEAALPSTDAFVPGGGLAALAGLLPLLGASTSGRRRLRPGASDSWK